MNSPFDIQIPPLNTLKILSLSTPMLKVRKQPGNRTRTRHFGVRELGGAVFVKQLHRELLNPGRSISAPAEGSMFR